MKQPKAVKIDVQADRGPLQAQAFSALDGLDSAQLPLGQDLPLPEEAKTTPEGRQRLILRREKKDRGGKTVVVIGGYQGNPQFLEELARKLRKQLGCGGTVEQKEIIIQGDQPEAVAALLKRMGYRVAGVGTT